MENGVKIIEIDDKRYKFDDFGGKEVTDLINGCFYYEINGCIYQSRADYLSEVRDRKLKDLGI